MALACAPATLVGARVATPVKPAAAITLFAAENHPHAPPRRGVAWAGVASLDALLPASRHCLTLGTSEEAVRQRALGVGLPYPGRVYAVLASESDWAALGLGAADATIVVSFTVEGLGDEARTRSGSAIALSAPFTECEREPDTIPTDGPRRGATR